VKPWRIDGPQRGPDPPALADALRRLHEGRPGPPSPDDLPPVSTFPMTKAAREARRFDRENPFRMSP
jgi:hypothetical protein